MSQYDAIAQRALATITKKGADVTFSGGGVPVYDPLTDTFSGGLAEPVNGKAVQVDSDPARLAARNLVLTDPLTLLVAAAGLTVRPQPGMLMTWAGDTRTIKDVEDVAPDGNAILYTVVGAR